MNLAVNGILIDNGRSSLNKGESQKAVKMKTSLVLAFCAVLLLASPARAWNCSNPLAARVPVPTGTTGSFGDMIADTRLSVAFVLLVAAEIIGIVEELGQ
jgi:hypothetical protein